MSRFRRSHRSPKRKRRKRFHPSLARRASIRSAREQYIGKITTGTRLTKPAGGLNMLYFPAW
jgi:hypothetical protein